MSKRKRTYTPSPSVPSELESRYAAVLAVLSGEMSVTEAAEGLKLSRVQMQTLVHRAKESLVAGVAPRSPGRAAKSEREQQLEEKVSKLERENAQMHSRSQTAERLMDVMGGILRGRGRAPRRATAAKTTTTEDPEEPEPDGLVGEAQRMLEIGLTRHEVAKVLGVGATTLRRHLGAPGARRARPEPASHVASHADALVRTTLGLIGAEALSHATGLSRRTAAAIKAETLTTMERERVAGCDRIRITQVGILRGFDQLWVPTKTGLGLVLVCADGAVPYRTSLVVAERYDGPTVADALDADFRDHGAPLVCRLDLAACHRTSDVDAVLAHHGVLRLHGPPRYPQYYAQLERQNREHQAYLAAWPDLTLHALPDACTAMRPALNDAWPRRSLGWMTAAEKWATRTDPCDDRVALAADVADRAARLRRDTNRHGELDERLAQRLAIEITLVERGYLQRQRGGWC